MKNVIVNRSKFDIIPDNKEIHKGKAVLCITTGEVFQSAKEAANYYNVNYVTLIQHIAGKVHAVGGGRGNKKGEGIKFCYVSDMGYKANDISHYIIELKAKSEINIEKMQVMLKDALKLKEEEQRLKEAEEMNKQRINAIIDMLSQMVGQMT